MDAREPLAVGVLLDGKYTIDRVIGAGGFGITYLAFDKGLGIRVAIKEYFPVQLAIRGSSEEVHPKSRSSLEMFERLKSSFLREAQTIARFDHRAIVKVLAVFEANGTAYMVMAFEEGPNLKDWLKSLGRAPTQAELDGIAEPLLDALAMMHAADFLHRDIAPDNILLRSDGSPLLIDFGSARQIAAGMTSTFTGVVKDGYSPIEQYSTGSRSQGPWTDIYAFGATLYSAVTGRPPDDATLRSIEDTTFDCRTMPGFRPSFLKAIHAAIAVRPLDRPQSIADWLPIFQFSGQPDLSQVPKRRKFAPAWSNAAWIAAAVVLAVAVSLGNFALAPYWDGERPDDTRGSLEAASRVARGERAFQEARSRDTTRAYQAFLSAHGDHGEAKAARERLSLLQARLDRARSEGRRRQAIIRRQREAETAAWQAVRAMPTIEGVQAFLEQFGGGTFNDDARLLAQRLKDDAEREKARRDAAEAERRKQEIAAAEAERRALLAADETAWQIALAVNTRQSLDAYLAHWPNGAFASAARARKAVVEAEEVLQQQREALRLETGIGRELVRLGCATTTEGRLSQDRLGTALADVNQRVREPIAANLSGIDLMDRLKAMPDGLCHAPTLEQIAVMTRTLQSELFRVGCLTTPATGNWDSASKAAIDLFNQLTNSAIASGQPTAVAISVLAATTTRVCGPPPLAQPPEARPKRPDKKKAPPARRREKEPRSSPKPAARNCRLETPSECIHRVCPGGGCGLRGSGICRPYNRRRICE